MKNLRELLKDITILELKGDLDVFISSVSLNSKTIEKGALFVALVGTLTDGHKYIEDSIEKGATVIIHQNDLDEYKDGVTYVKVVDSHETIGLIASAFYDHPSESLKLIGVTGTNGKTTVVTLLHQLFLNIGHRAGMIGTVVNKINDKSFETERTTPDPVTLNKLLKEMVDAECNYCFMEVSSHSVSEKRVAGLIFAGGIFTNLTLDHLDYHKTIENYRDAKKMFFDTLTVDTFALSNIDDENGDYIISETKAKKYFYGFKKEADFDERLETKLIGEFNQYNILAIYAASVLLDEDRGLVRSEIKKLEPVAGRFQYVKGENGVVGVVDYAHTPDALENVLKTANGLREPKVADTWYPQNLRIPGIRRFGRIISVFGCGGDRDKSKRPIMAKIGYDMSDILILTSDNPRTENPESILDDMVVGLPEGYEKLHYAENIQQKKVYRISDRHEAIQKACELAQSGDYILLAGKGHENYQEVNGVKNHFDDLEELNNFLK